MAVQVSHLQTTGKLTFREALAPAMTIDNEEDASLYFEALVQRTMRESAKTRDEAERLQRSNLGYYAGYYDLATQERVERLFGGVHPVFGPVQGHEWTTAEVLEAGKRMGEALRQRAEEE